MSGAPEPPHSTAVAPGTPVRVIELDFIRGIAILLVIFHHFDRQVLERIGVLSPGWAGVSLFFVLSGFLVGGILIKEWKRTKHVDGLRFLKRRILKIWPAYYFYLLLEIIFHPHPYSTFLVGNLLNIQNYTGTSLGHTWSLAVEEHFYLFLTLMLVIVSARGWTPRRTLILCAGIALTVAISRSVIFYLYGTATIFQTQSQMDALMLGVMLAMLLNFWPATFAAIQARWGWLVLLFCFALTWVMNERLFPFYYLETVAVDLGCAAILLLLFRPITCPDRNWFYRLVALIGTYSYSIYLWHLASGLAAERLVAKLPVVLQTLGWPVLWAAPYVAAFLAGVISAKLVEFPFLKLRERWVPSPKGTHLLSDSAPASAVQ